MSGTTGANLPVRIEVQGTQQAEAQFNRVGQAGQAAMQRVTQSTDDASGSARRFGYVAGQAGFQVQDFAVQVQGGTSALTALSQQGSQLLGIFGTGGAIAGAVLTVGILAYQLLSASDSTKELEQAQERLARQMQRTNEFLETGAERAARLAREQRSAAAIGPLTESITVERQLSEERRALELLQRQRQELIQSNSQLPGFNPNAVLREPIEQRIAEIQRLEGILSTLSGQQQAVLTGPSGEQRDQAGALRRQLDERYRIAQQYDERIRELRGLAAVGLFGQDELNRLERQAATERDEQLSRLTPTSNVENRLNQARTQQAEELNREIERLTRSVETPLERYQQRLAEITRLAQRAEADGNPIPAETIQRATDAALADFERLERGTKRMGDEAQRAGGYAQQLGLSFSSAFEDAIVKGEGLSSILQGLEQDIARIIIRSAVTTPLANAIAGVISPFGTSIGNAFADPTLGGKVGGSISVSAAGARASGGPVFPGGTYLVGERGPELLTMGAAGFVTPNVGGPSITQNFNIDARGADASMVPRLRAEMVAIARASNAELLDSIQRGGSAARIVGRRA
jgi:hypothetical protein